MKPIPMMLACATLLALSAGPASAAPNTNAPATPVTPTGPTVVNFDSLRAGAMSTYGGFTWTNWISVTGNTGAYHSNSPDAWATATDNINSISRATTFVFDGAWFSGPATAPNPLNPNGRPVNNQLHYQLWLGDALVFTGSSFVPNSQISTWQGSSYTGAVNKVVVLANATNHFAMDDFTYSPATNAVTPPITSPVPEPQSGQLMAAGLMLLLVARRGLAARRDR